MIETQENSASARNLLAILQSRSSSDCVNLERSRKLFAKFNGCRSSNWICPNGIHAIRLKSSPNATFPSRMFRIYQIKARLPRIS